MVVLTNEPQSCQLTATIYDASSGARVGQWTSAALSASTTVVNIPESEIEQQQGKWTVSTFPQLINLQFSAIPAGGGNAYPPGTIQIAGNWFTQSATGDTTNVVTLCRN